MARKLGPVPIGVPVPSSLISTIYGVLAGSWFDILWKLMVIGVGLFILIAALAAGTGVLLGIVASIVIGVTFSDNIRRLLRDIYYRRFTFLGP